MLPHRGAEEKHTTSVAARLVPTGPSDHRPGRPPAAPKALVVDADAARRRRLAGRLQDESYEVVTCPGPASGSVL